MNIPEIDFIGIGAGRSGTTWIHTCLSQHPDICGSDPKETKILQQPELDLSQYKDVFSHCESEKVRGEFSTRYLYLDTTRNRIQKHFPNAKLIVALRDPVERALSKYHFDHSREKVGYENIEKRIKKDLSDFNHQSGHPLTAGFYHKPLKKYIDTFSNDQIHICLFKDIKKKPAELIRSLYSFLNVDPDYTPPSLQERINYPVKNRYRIPYLKKSMYAVWSTLQEIPGGRHFVAICREIGLPQAVNRIHTKYNMRNLSNPNRKKMERKDISPELRKQLEALYEPEKEKMESLIDRDLSHWC